MVYKNKNKIVKRFLPLILTISIVSSTFLPIFTPRAQALIPVTDYTAKLKALIDGIAMVLAKKMVNDMVQSTVTWANTGFEGKPAFVTNPGSYFGNIADQSAGQFINSSSLGFLCTPFQQNIRLSLADSYRLSTGASYAPTCSITGIKGNIQDFYQSFSRGGGWDTWFSMTQVDDNNPYGAYLNASIELDRRLASKLGLEKTKIDWGEGFKSKAKCLIYNPTSEQVNEAYKKGQVLPSDPSYGPGECVKYDPNDKTPSVVIKDQLDKILPSGLESLISVEHVEQLINAFVQGLLTRYVFGEKGLFGSDYADTFNNQEVPQIWSPVISNKWIYCANENELCEFTGQKVVRFGNGQVFNTGTYTDRVDCTSEVFGDIGSGTTRWCEYSAEVTTPPPGPGCNDNAEVGSGNGSSDPCIPPTESQGALRCFPTDDNEIHVGDGSTSWTLTGDAVVFPATYVWHGEEVEGLTEQTVGPVSYSTTGIKTPTVTFNPNGKTDSQTKTVTCASLKVYDKNDIQASCSAVVNNPSYVNATYAYTFINEVATWDATISGGSGKYTLTWGGDESDVVNGVSPWDLIDSPITYDPATGISTIAKQRKYQVIGKKYANLLIEDKDPTVASYYISQCENYMDVAGTRPPGT